MRGLESSGAARQLALPVVEHSERAERLWESLPPMSQERILRLLAAPIARFLGGWEQQR